MKTFKTLLATAVLAAGLFVGQASAAKPGAYFQNPEPSTATKSALSWQVGNAEFRASTSDPTNYAAIGSTWGVYSKFGITAATITTTGLISGATGQFYGTVSSTSGFVGKFFGDGAGLTNLPSGSGLTSGYSAGVFQGNYNTMNVTGNATLAVSGSTATLNAAGGGGGGTTTNSQSTYTLQMNKDFDVYQTTTDFIGTGLKYTVLNASMTLLECKCFTAYSSTAGSTFFEIVKSTVNALNASTFTTISPTIEVSTGTSTAMKVSSGMAFAANTVVNYGESFAVHITKIPGSGTLPRNFGCNLQVVGELLVLAGAPASSSTNSVNSQVYLDTGTLRSNFELHKTTADTNAAQIANSTGAFRTSYEIFHNTSDLNAAQIANSTGTFRTEYEVHHATADSKLAQLSIDTTTNATNFNARLGATSTVTAPFTYNSSVTFSAGISVSSNVVIKSSVTVMGVVNSTTGFQAPSSSFSVVFVSSISFPQWTLVPSTQPTAGQHLIVGKVSGTNVYLEGGGDGGGGAGGGDAFLANNQTFTGNNTFSGLVTAVSTGIFNRIGIGSSTPGYELVVSSSKNDGTNIRISNSVNGSAAYAGISIVAGGNNPPDLGILVVPSNNNDVALQNYASAVGFEAGDGASNGLIFTAVNTGAPVIFRSGGRTSSSNKLSLNPTSAILSESIGINGTPTSSLDILGGSITVRRTGTGIDGGISAATMTINGTNVWFSTQSIRLLDGTVLVESSGTLGTSTAISYTPTMFKSTLSFIWPGVCSGVKSGSPTASTIVFSPFTNVPNAVGVENVSAVTAEDFICWFLVK